MASLFDLSMNLSIYSIPIAWVLAFAPHAYGSTLAKRHFDPRSPRTLAENLKNSQTIDQATKDRIIRAEGAHANGFENLGLYATAVLAGNMAGLPASTLNALTGGYLLSRLLYNWVYINNTTVQIAGVRSLVYMCGIGCIITLFVQAGNVLREKGVVSL